MRGWRGLACLTINCNWQQEGQGSVRCARCSGSRMGPRRAIPQPAFHTSWGWSAGWSAALRHPPLTAPSPHTNVVLLWSADCLSPPHPPPHTTPNPPSFAADQFRVHTVSCGEQTVTHPLSSFVADSGCTQ